MVLLRVRTGPIFIVNVWCVTGRLIGPPGSLLWRPRNLAFWVAVEDYKMLPHSDRKKRAEEIYCKYFRSDSSYEVRTYLAAPGSIFCT